MTNLSPGTVALVGSGEFLSPMAPVDRALLETLNEPWRVAIVPTASAPDGDAVFERWLRLGDEHFRDLKATVDPIALKTRADAENVELAERISRTNFVYLSGGKPPYLRDTLADTVCWKAIVDVYNRGGVIAGCSAGAMVLGNTMLSFRLTRGAVPGLGLIPGIVIIPHFDEFPMNLAGLLVHIPESSVLAGVEGMTALVGRAGQWSVAGRGGVTIADGTTRTRYTAGQAVAIG
ncbi:MAG TPA: Type 1 glutamine amidotransferase-like domain-containing protein [Chloroflexota bacterium]|nr:Type 1 glutamine amidotransferase-like domain-containing protein [Chloroflexota bacterium]